MGCAPIAALEANLAFTVMTRRNGALADCDAAPTYEVYDAPTHNVIATGTMTKTLTGNYSGVLAVSAEAGYLAQTTYVIHVMGLMLTVAIETTMSFLAVVSVQAEMGGGVGGGYALLEVGKRHLKNLDALVDDPQLGLTQDDLDDAMLQAKAEIDGKLAAYYDVSGWLASPPPLIVVVADHIGSGVVLAAKFARDGAGPSKTAEAMQEEGRKTLERIVEGASGSPRGLHLVDAAGNLIGVKGGAGPAIANHPRRGRGGIGGLGELDFTPEGRP